MEQRTKDVMQTDTPSPFVRSPKKEKKIGWLVFVIR